MSLLQKIEFMMSEMGNFFWPFIKQFMSAAAPILKDAALAAVQAVATSSLNSGNDPDGTLRRKAAFDQIEQTLIQQGIQLGAREINSAIEVAVAHMQAGA